MSELVAQSRVFQISPVGTVVEISFRGTHEGTHGSVMHRYVEEAILENRPSAIVFNLLDYQYVFGNDVTALFTAAYNRDTKRPRPVYIAATGTTYKSLRNLFNSGRIQEAFRVEFVENIEDAVQRLGAEGDDSVSPACLRARVKKPSRAWLAWLRK